MKLLPCLMLNVVVVTAGILLYDALRDPGGRTPDPLAEPEMLRFEQQLEEAGRRRIAAVNGPASRNPRRDRIAQYVRGMKLGLAADAEIRLLEAIEGFHAARDTFWREQGALADGPYAAAYRQLVEPTVQAVRGFIADPAQADLVIRSFVFDGQIVRPPTGFGGRRLQPDR